MRFLEIKHSFSVYFLVIGWFVPELCPILGIKPTVIISQHNIVPIIATSLPVLCYRFDIMSTSLTSVIIPIIIS